MKRESIAETTLMKQIKNIDAIEKVYLTQIAELDAKLVALSDIKSTLETEVAHLKDARIKASNSRKP